MPIVKQERKIQAVEMKCLRRVAAVTRNVNRIINVRISRIVEMKIACISRRKIVEDCYWYWSTLTEYGKHSTNQNCSRKITESGVVCVCAVSYTHLDVYKRQGL